MKRVLRGFVVVLMVVLLFGVFTFSSEARTIKSYAQKSIFSVLGDSISSYKGYEDWVYYGASGYAYNINKNDMWWSVYTNSSNETMGWSASVSSAQVAMDESNFLSFFYPSRLNDLDNNGTPDYIAVFGGTNDANAGISSSSFYSSYNQLINKLHSMFDGIKLILMAPNYFPTWTEYATTLNSRIDSYDNSIRNIANTYRDYYVDLRGQYNNTDDCNTSDHFHPSETGMSKIAAAITTALSTQRGGKTTGIESIRADLDYDHYIIKVNAYDPSYDNLNFKFKLTSSKGEVIYDTGWQKNNCFYLDEVDPKATYTAVAEIDNGNDGIAEDSMTRNITNLVKKRTGGTVYNGVDYSKVYDFNYYVENNADLYNTFKNDPNGALEHFVKNGMSEARQAKSTFNVISYRNRWSDLRRAFGWNNLVAYYKHYMDCGYKEGRQATGCNTLQDPINNFFGYDCSAIYDYQYYMEHNPDVKNAFNADEQQVFLHFISCGMSEGRRSCANFDVSSYRNQYSDLRQIFGWNNLASYYAHYNDCGRKEGRAGTGCTTLQNPVHSFWGVDFSPVYNYQYYIEHNPDVYRAFNGDDVAIFGHFISCGVNEGRRASERFDVVSYRNQWSDLRQIFGWNNLAQYYFHYVNSGAREGRPATGCSTVQNPTHTFLGIDISAVYDYQYYIEHNPDVKNAFGGDDTAVMIHFVASGMTEGRQASREFNVWTYAANNPDLVTAFGLDLAQYYRHYFICGKREGRVAV